MMRTGEQEQFDRQARAMGFPDHETMVAFYRHRRTRRNQTNALERGARGLREGARERNPLNLFDWIANQISDAQ